MYYLPGWSMMHIKDVEIRNVHDYNRMLTDRQFWAGLEYDKVLIFQHDSMILRDGIDEFLDWDFVGSPWRTDTSWARPDRHGGNGGISVRDVDAHATLLRHTHYHPCMGNEDVFFVHHLPNVAPYEVCSRFGVETEFRLGTLCYHQIDERLTVEQCHQVRNQYA